MKGNNLLPLICWVFFSISCVCCAVVAGKVLRRRRKMYKIQLDVEEKLVSWEMHNIILSWDLLAYDLLLMLYMLLQPLLLYNMWNIMMNFLYFSRNIGSFRGVTFILALCTFIFWIGFENPRHILNPYWSKFRFFIHKCTISIIWSVIDGIRTQSSQKIEL